MPSRQPIAPGRHSRGYPRPQMEREQWQLLTGEWDAALDRDGIWRTADDVQWTQRIVVPFSPEVPLSGIHDASYFQAVWYRREEECPVLAGDRRWILHFGAVDYRATVWVDGRVVGEHEGGYTPFAVDLSACLPPDRGVVTIVVRAEDDPHDLAKPRGKQDWQLEPHSIWYPRTSGIWQTVWTEIVPATRIGAIRWTPNLERWEIGFEAW